MTFKYLYYWYVKSDIISEFEFKLFLQNAIHDKYQVLIWAEALDDHAKSLGPKPKYIPKRQRSLAAPDSTLPPASAQSSGSGRLRKRKSAPSSESDRPLQKRGGERLAKKEERVLGSVSVSVFGHYCVFISRLTIAK
jgi:hypothetical protein